MVSDTKQGQRFAVIGSTGSGKTTFARQLAQRLGIMHVELDSLHWEANWHEAPLEVFRERTERALSATHWVVDGNYSKVRDIVWNRADTVIWLDYALPVVLWRLLRRTLKRIVTREALWSGNRESWRSQFLSRNSLFLWALKTYFRRRHEYPGLFRQPEFAHLAVIHLRSPQAAQSWLESLPIPQAT